LEDQVPNGRIRKKKIPNNAQPCTNNTDKHADLQLVRLNGQHVEPHTQFPAAFHNLFKQVCGLQRSKQANKQNTKQKPSYSILSVDGGIREKEE
jgi:hypothetical protein